MQQLSQDQDQDEARAFLHQVGSPLADSPPGTSLIPRPLDNISFIFIRIIFARIKVILKFFAGSWPTYGSPVERNSLHGYSQTPTLGSLSPVGSGHLTGLALILPSHASNPVKIAPIGKDPGRLTQGVAFQNHFSIPERNLSSSPGPVSPFDYSKPSSVGTLSGPQFLWGSPSVQSEHATSSAWSSSLRARPFTTSGQGVGFPFPSQRGPFLGSHHHVGSAPSGIQLERHLGFFPDSPETSYINQAAFGATNFGRNGGSHVNIGVAFAGNYTDSGSPSSRMMSMTRNGPVYYGNGSFGATSNDVMMDRGRSRRGESGSQVDNKKQYQLDLEKIMSGEDSRTTLMIKNIPNK